MTDSLRETEPLKSALRKAIDPSSSLEADSLPLLPQGDSDGQKSFVVGDGRTRIIVDFDDAITTDETTPPRVGFYGSSPLTWIVSEQARQEIEAQWTKSIQQINETLMAIFIPAMRATMEDIEDFVQSPPAQELLRQANAAAKAEQADARSRDPKRKDKDRSKSDVQAKRKALRGGKGAPPRQRMKRGRR